MIQTIVCGDAKFDTVLRGSPGHEPILRRVVFRELAKFHDRPHQLTSFNLSYLRVVKILALRGLGEMPGARVTPGGIQPFYSRCSGCQVPQQDSILGRVNVPTAAKIPQVQRLFGHYNTTPILSVAKTLARPFSSTASFGGIPLTLKAIQAAGGRISEVTSWFAFHRFPSPSPSGTLCSYEWPDAFASMPALPSVTAIPTNARKKSKPSSATPVRPSLAWPNSVNSICATPVFFRVFRWHR